MNSRKIYPARYRYVALGCWKAASALHLGGESEAFEHATDMALLRDSSGEFYIPAASIAGAGRNYLARELLTVADYERGRGAEPPAMLDLFGGGSPARNNPARQYASLLSTFDAPRSDGPNLETRDGVRIDPRYGVAADQAKYDFEVLPRDTSFQFRMDLVEYAQPLRASAGDVLQHFAGLLCAFQEGRIRLGARTRRGLGQGRLVNLKVYRLDLAQKGGLLAWLRQTPEAGEDVTVAVLGQPPLATGGRLTFRIEAKLDLRTSLLIRSATGDPADPDVMHLCENGAPLLSGSSLAGPLRHRVERIAKTLGIADAERLVKRMFGGAPESWKPRGNQPRDPEEIATASRVHVSEQQLTTGQYHVQSRVRIDRFTGGARDAALFEEAPLWPNGPGHAAEISIVLEDPQPREQGLLLLALKDLWLGDLTLGGEAAAGRGVFEGRWARISGLPGMPSCEVYAAEGANIRIEPPTAEAALNAAVQSIAGAR